MSSGRQNDSKHSHVDQEYFTFPMGDNPLKCLVIGFLVPAIRMGPEEFLRRCRLLNNEANLSETNSLAQTLWNFICSEGQAEVSSRYLANLETGLGRHLQSLEGSRLEDKVDNFRKLINSPISLLQNGELTMFQSDEKCPVEFRILADGRCMFIGFSLEQLQQLPSRIPKWLDLPENVQNNNSEFDTDNIYETGSVISKATTHLTVPKTMHGEQRLHERNIPESEIRFLF